MREIKFRAWDVQNKYWIDSDNVSVSASGYWQVYDPDGDMFHSANNGEIIVNRFTGLKDKNGKEIYEGDIIKYGGIGSFGPLLIIEWFKGGFMQKYVSGEFDWKNEWDTELMQIIGNIYKNPELLDKE